MIRQLICAALIAGAAALPARDAGASYVGSAAQKLALGVADIVWSPVELVATPVAWGANFDAHERLALMGFLVGIPVGVAQGVTRLGLGVAEVLTFPIADPQRSRSWRPFLAPPTPLDPPPPEERYGYGYGRWW
jgi:putative exosortase-associated protein (TIGR04073 family)